MNTLGTLLKAMRERSPLLTRREASLRTDISEEHLRNIEADKSRPSSSVLLRLLSAYDQPELNSLAWQKLAYSILPPEVAPRVEIHRKEM